MFVKRMLKDNPNDLLACAELAFQVPRFDKATPYRLMTPDGLRELRSYCQDSKSITDLIDCVVRYKEQHPVKVCCCVRRSDMYLFIAKG